MADLPEPARTGLVGRRRSGVVLIVIALCATLAVPVFIGGKAALLATLTLPVAGYVALLGVIAISWVARAFKLRMLLRRMGVRLGVGHALEMSLATDFGFLATPAGIGGYAASIYYARRAGASTSAAAALTAADQGLDLAFFAIAIPLAGFAFFGSDLPPALIATALTASSVFVALAITAFFARRTLEGWCSGGASPVAGSPRWRRAQRALIGFCAHMRQQLQLLLDAGPRFFAGVFAWTVLQWTMRYGVLWVVLAVLGYRVSYPLIVALQGLVLHVAQWSGIPAGGGGAELGLTATLTTWVPAVTLATALLLWRMVTLYLALVAGAIAIGLLARRPPVFAPEDAAGADVAEGSGTQ